MLTDEVTPMKNLTNQSLSQRCISVVSHIKRQAENRPQLPHRTNRNVNQNAILRIKRLSIKELDSVQAARKKSFATWPHFAPNRNVMATNGWFYCNINDRAMCIYCGTICHGWKNSDDPYEVHSRLAPECPFILSISSSSSKDVPSMVTENPTETFQPRHSSMCEITRRQETFNNQSWTQTSPSIEDLVYAGFYYSGNENTVTCFYCGGSLNKWSVNDNPKVEHSRWFPDCLYARHLCGDLLHAQIQMKKNQVSIENNGFDKETIARLINSRLDLPIVQRLRKQYRLAIIKRCIENQFKNHQDDFEADNDLVMACFILQKQFDLIRSNRDKLIIPSQEQISIHMPEMSKRKLEDCLVCLTEEKQLACMPCGHLCTCVPCGYALRSCPICRTKIQSFVRIYC